MGNEVNYDKLREMIARCQWTFARSMPFAPHEYIVRGRAPLTDEEFVYFIDMQRRFGIVERWGRYNNPYLYIDDYKYWTMGDPYDVTTVINRAKACVVDDVHKLYESIQEIKQTDMKYHEYLDGYISRKLGLKTDNSNMFNVELLNGRLKEISECVSHLERLRINYNVEILREWSKQLSKDFPKLTKIEFIDPDHPDHLYTGVAIPYKQWPDSISILIQAKDGRLFYGFSNFPKFNDRRDEMLKELSYVAVCNDLYKSEHWLYYRYTSYDKGYEKLKELITNMTE